MCASSPEERKAIETIKCTPPPERGPGSCRRDRIIYKSKAAVGKSGLWLGWLPACLPACYVSEKDAILTLGPVSQAAEYKAENVCGVSARPHACCGGQETEHFCFWFFRPKPPGFDDCCDMCEAIEEFRQVWRKVLFDCQASWFSFFFCCFLAFESEGNRFCFSSISVRGRKDAWCFYRWAILFDFYRTAYQSWSRFVVLLLLLHSVVVFTSPIVEFYCTGRWLFRTRIIGTPVLDCHLLATWRSFPFWNSMGDHLTKLAECQSETHSTVTRASSQSRISSVAFNFQWTIKAGFDKSKNPYPNPRIHVSIFMNEWLDCEQTVNINIMCGARHLACFDDGLL